MLDLDSFDLALLDALQKEGRATHHQLAEHVALSASQIGRRLQRLEAAGVIEGYRVVLRPEALGLAVTAFTTLRLQHHGDQVIERFQAEIDLLPEVLECHMVVGGFDYLVKARIREISQYRSLLGDILLRLPGVTQTKSCIVMEEVKETLFIPAQK